METAFTRGLRDTLAPPRAAPVTATLAPPAVVPHSVHADIVSSTEDAMIGTMQDLRIDAVEKNAELAAALAVISDRRDEALRRLVDVVSPSRLARLSAARDAIASALGELDLDLLSRTASTFSALDAACAPPGNALTALDGVETTFYATEVPRSFEQQCGSHVRAMERSREEVELDKTSSASRDAKFEERFAEHCETFRRRAAAETEDRATQYASLDKLFADSFTSLERSARDSAGLYPASIAAVADALEQETLARVAADARFVEDIKLTMSRLREIALAAYGLDSEDDGT